MSEVKHHDLSPALARQRRNLMASSLVLIFFTIAEAEFSSVVVLGLSVTFGRPEAVPGFIIAFSIYFAYRYALYLSQESDLKLRSEFYARFNSNILPKLEVLRNKKFGTFQEKVVSDPIEKIPPSSIRSGLRVRVIKERTGPVNQPKHGVVVIPPIMVAMAAIRSSMQTFLLRSYFTDYVLPLVLVVVSWLVAFALIFV